MYTRLARIRPPGACRPWLARSHLPGAYTVTPVDPGVEISIASAKVLPQLREVFLSLHDHHRRITGVPLTEPDERAWTARVSTYQQFFDQGQALLHVARADGGCVGYALTLLHAGSDDTFPLGAGYAELYTLAVLPRWRGNGVGSALLDAVDRALRERGVVNLTVATMCTNEAAIRLYRRRGLIPAELILYRIGAPGTVDQRTAGDPDIGDARIGDPDSR